METGGVKLKRAEIDTRKPFRSVKEAVSLFGDKVLAGELYSNRLKQMHGRDQRRDTNELKLGNVAAELEETKQSLEKAKEESMVMAHCLSSLQEELENTKKELQFLKESELFHQSEDIKVVDAAAAATNSMEFQKKRYVTFANPPAAVAHLVIPPPTGVEKLERLSSFRREKNKMKKTLIPLISAIFSKKK